MSVVTVVYNAAGHLPQLLASLQEEGNRPAEIVVVDNGSTDGSLDLLAAADGLVCVAQDNTGFAHGVNRGIALAHDDADILVLNPDVRLRPGVIRTLAAVLERYPDAGIVAPRLVDEHGDTLRSCRRSPSVLRTLLEAVVGGTHAGRFAEAYAPGEQAQDVDWATGAALLLRRGMLDDIGGMDESFFLYSEETELCLRAKACGYRVIVEPEATVTHVGGGLSAQPRLWALRAVNRVRRYRASKGRLRGWGFRAAQSLFELRRAVTGDPLSREALRSLAARDLDLEAQRLTRALGGQTRPMQAARSRPAGG